MKAFLDTSVLVAALLPFHERHAEALALMKELRGSGTETWIAGHTLVETYAVLTGYPTKPRIGPREACRMLKENFGAWLKVATLAREEYWDFLGEATEKNIAGGRTYDALIAGCARKSGATRWYTFNFRDFGPFARPGVEIAQPAPASH